MSLYSVDKDGKKTLQHQTKPATRQQPVAAVNQPAADKSKAASTQTSKEEQ